MKSQMSLLRRLDELDISWSIIFAGLLALGVIVIVAYAAALDAQPLKTSAVALFIAGAASAGGVFIGFLFGIPRTLQQEPAKATVGQPLISFQPLGVNTNLEQISDWLTKIIVGVGLVELKQLPERAVALSKSLSHAFGAIQVPHAFVFCVCVYFAVYGFLVGYLWARVKLTSIFSQAEKEARETPEYYEGLVNAFLYQPMPKGFERAIAIGLDFNERFGPTNVRIWEYLACAYAQQYRFLSLAPEPDKSAMQTARSAALTAIKMALQISQKEAKSLLAPLWVKTAPEGEDDLKIFAEDQDFADLLG